MGPEFLFLLEMVMPMVNETNDSRDLCLIKWSK